jgi:hypothetical protein
LKHDRASRSFELIPIVTKFARSGTIINIKFISRQCLAANEIPLSDTKTVLDRHRSSTFEICGYGQAMIAVCYIMSINLNHHPTVPTGWLAQDAVALESIDNAIFEFVVGQNSMLPHGAGAKSSMPAKSSRVCQVTTNIMFPPNAGYRLNRQLLQLTLYNEKAIDPVLNAKY